jgi:hypothetical protein
MQIMLIEKDNLSMQTYHPWIISNLWYFGRHPFLLFGCTYWIWMSNSKHPWNFGMFCIDNITCLHCFKKVVIFLKLHPCTLWDEPHPPVKMLMMPNNMSEVKHTTKVHHTYCICCIWVWSSSHLDLVFLKIRSKVFFSFYFCFICRLFKIQHSWKCGLVT